MGEGKPGLIQSGQIQVQALLDALESNSEPERTIFGQALLARFGEQARQAILDLPITDLLFEILRMLLESELESALVQFGRTGINRKEINRLVILFWGALTIHTELFLRLPLAGAKPFVLEIGGEYVIELPGDPVYKIQNPLSASKMQSLFATLGIDFLTRYLDEHLIKKTITELFQKLGAQQKLIIEWIELVNVRSLERAQRVVRQRLWDQYADINTHTHARGSGGAANIQSYRPVLADRPINSQSDIWVRYDKTLADRLAAQDDLLFIPTEIEIEDADGKIVSGKLEDLLEVRGMCLLAGLPGGGKSYLHAWAARERRGTRWGLDYFVNLDEYARSGLGSLFEYAADRLRRDFHLPVHLDELKNELIELDRQGQIIWRVDRWDRLYPHERERALSGLAALTNVLVATSDPQSYARLSLERSLPVAQTIFHLQCWNGERQADYQALVEKQHPVDERNTALVKALPGLVRLPGGMAYLLKSTHTNLMDVLLGYMAEQQKRGNARLALRIDRARGLDGIDWGDSDLNQLFTAVASLMQAGLARRYEPERLAQIDRVIIGACLPQKEESLEVRMRQADEYLESGLRSGLLVRSGVSRFAFAVPEIGYLMAAMASYGTSAPEAVNKQTLAYANRWSTELSAQVLIDFSRWYADMFSQRR